MNLEAQRMLITGASGGIGRELCIQLATRGAWLCLVTRNGKIGAKLAQELKEFSTKILIVQADITKAEERNRVVNSMLRAWGNIDVLINLAGVMDFSCFEDQDPDTIHRILEVNIEAPMQLTRCVLAQMMARRYGRIVNVGSMFGSIGFPCFATYSASKFALRGFSQALRRELIDSGVGVTYIAPRAVRTPFNPPAVHRMAELGMIHMDDPKWVANHIVNAIRKEKDEAYLGFPESFFARINAILPKIVSRAINKQVPALISFTQQSADNQLFNEIV